MTEISKTYNVGTINLGSVGGGDNSTLLSVLDGTATELTADDLKGLTNIKRYAFYGDSNLKKLELPEGLESIERNAFQWSTGLTELTLPESLTSFSSAFTLMTNLKKVNVYCKDLVQSNAIYNCENVETINIYNTERISYDFYGSESYDNKAFNIVDGGKYLGNETNPYVAILQTCEIGCIIKDNALLAKDFLSYNNKAKVVYIPENAKIVDSPLKSNTATVPEHILCEASSKPSSWPSDWINSNLSHIVKWGYPKTGSYYIQIYENGNFVTTEIVTDPFIYKAPNYTPTDSSASFLGYYSDSSFADEYKLEIPYYTNWGGGQVYALYGAGGENGLTPETAYIITVTSDHYSDNPIEKEFTLSTDTGIAYFKFINNFDYATNIRIEFERLSGDFDSGMGIFNEQYELLRSNDDDSSYANSQPGISHYSTPGDVHYIKFTYYNVRDSWDATPDIYPADGDKFKIHVYVE